MTDPNVTETVIEQGKALVRAIEALGTIESDNWFEQSPSCDLLPSRAFSRARKPCPHTLVGPSLIVFTGFFCPAPTRPWGAHCAPSPVSGDTGLVER